MSEIRLHTFINDCCDKQVNFLRIVAAPVKRVVVYYTLPEQHDKNLALSHCESVKYNITDTFIKLWAVRYLLVCCVTDNQTVSSHI